VTFFRRKMKGREAKGTVEKEKPGEDGRTYIATELGRKQKDTQRFGWEGGGNRSGCVKGDIFDCTLNLELVEDA
jgi:hypothetical protein